MRPDGSYQCAGCGAPLDVPEGEKPQAALMAASGKTTVRVLKVNGREIHRREILSLLPRSMADRAGRDACGDDERATQKPDLVVVPQRPD